MKKYSIIGIMRYSCNCFETKPNFNTDYIDYRLKIFTNITIPSLQAQNDNDFIVAVLHSENLPEKYKKIFTDLCEKHPFLKCIYIKDGTDVCTASQQVITKYADLSHPAITTFRLDNDDAVSINFIKTLRKYTTSAYINTAISLPHVRYIMRIGDDKYVLQHKKYPSNAAGLAYVSDTTAHTSVMDLGHHVKVRKKYPMITDNTPGGLITLNGVNCANKLQHRFLKKLRHKIISTQKANALLRPHYGDIALNDLKILPYQGWHQQLAFSSHPYLLHKDDVLSLPKNNAFKTGKHTIILLGNKDKNISDTLLSSNLADNTDYIKVYIAYTTYNRFISVLLHCFKHLKRKIRITGSHSYRTKLAPLLQDKLLSGCRTRQTAYNFSNKKWQQPLNERTNRYNSLYDSIKTHGFDSNHPIFMGLNRHYGAKDKLLQGNHRICACKELQVDDITITFSTYPKINKNIDLS